MEDTLSPPKPHCQQLRFYPEFSNGTQALHLTGSVTSLISLPTTPALMVFFLVLKYAKLKHVKHISPQSLCICFFCLERISSRKLNGLQFHFIQKPYLSNRPSTTTGSSSANLTSYCDSALFFS
jgi:hypothetical protein